MREERPCTGAIDGPPEEPEEARSELIPQKGGQEG